MSRHNKRRIKPSHPVTRQENGIKILCGKIIASSAELQLVYERGGFYYQFHGVGKTSRIMNCDNTGELQWLKNKVDRGVRILVRRFPETIKMQFQSS